MRKRNLILLSNKTRCKLKTFKLIKRLISRQDYNKPANHSWSNKLTMLKLRKSKLGFAMSINGWWSLHAWLARSGSAHIAPCLEIIEVMKFVKKLKSRKSWRWTQNNLRFSLPRFSQWFQKLMTKLPIGNFLTNTGPRKMSWKIKYNTNLKPGVNSLEWSKWRFLINFTQAVSLVLTSLFKKQRKQIKNCWMMLPKCKTPPLI